MSFTAVAASPQPERQTSDNPYLSWVLAPFFAAPTWAAHAQLHTPALCAHGRDNPGWVTQKHPPLLQEYPGTGMWKPGGLCLSAGAQEEGRMNTFISVHVFGRE